MELATPFAAKLNTFYLLQDKVAAEKTAVHGYLSRDLIPHQLIENVSGGQVTDLLRKVLSYYKENLFNLHFRVVGTLPYPWNNFLKKKYLSTGAGKKCYVSKCNKSVYL